MSATAIATHRSTPSHESRRRSRSHRQTGGQEVGPHLGIPSTRSCRCAHQARSPSRARGPHSHKRLKPSMSIGRSTNGRAPRCRKTVAFLAFITVRRASSILRSVIGVVLFVKLSTFDGVDFALSPNAPAVKPFVQQGADASGAQDFFHFVVPRPESRLQQSSLPEPCHPPLYCRYPVHWITSLSEDTATIGQQSMVGTPPPQRASRYRHRNWSIPPSSSRR